MGRIVESQRLVLKVEVCEGKRQGKRRNDEGMELLCLPCVPEAGEMNEAGMEWRDLEWSESPKWNGSEVNEPAARNGFVKSAMAKSRLWPCAVDCARRREWGRCRLREATKEQAGVLSAPPPASNNIAGVLPPNKNKFYSAEGFGGKRKPA